MKELEKSATSKGLRAPLSALLLLGYHTYAAQIFGNILFFLKTFIARFHRVGNGDGDLKKAHTLVEHYLKRSPTVS